MRHYTAEVRISRSEEAEGDRRLPETNLPAAKADPQEVLTRYNRSAEVEPAFSELKSYLEVRPVYRRRRTRVRNPIRICFPAL